MLHARDNTVIGIPSRAGALTLVAFVVLSTPVPTAQSPAASRARETGTRGPVIVPLGLQVEYAVDPLGIDTATPRLSWRMQTSMPGVRSQKQTGYQIVVATDLLFGEVAWDSGRIDSDDCVNIRYGGRQPLRAATRYYWRVKVWYRAGAGIENESDWSPVARWDMGLLEEQDWAGAEWIGLRSRTPRPDVDYNGIRDRISEISGFSAPLLRRDFSVPKKRIRNATVFLCGLGYYELYLNGRKVGDSVLDPGYTRYDATALYVAHDVTGLLLQGGGQAESANAIGVMLGRGFYGLTTPNEWNDHRAAWHAEPKMRMRLRILFEDGEVRDVVSKGAIEGDSSSSGVETFQAAEGPIVFDSVRAGEIYDANRERPGWTTVAYRNSPDYVRSRWAEAIRVAAVAGELRSQRIQPIRVAGTIASEAIAVTRPALEVAVYDMGGQMSGWSRITVSGSRGDLVEIRYAQRLRDGRADVAELTAPPLRGSFGTGAYQTDFYVLKGASEETYEPRFSFKGFRYVEVIGKPLVRKVEGRRVHTDTERAGAAPRGTFSSSSSVLNDFYAASRRSILDNLYSVPTDCPHTEKNGWTAEDHLAAEASLFSFDYIRLQEKRLNDLRDDQASLRDKTGSGASAAPLSGKIRLIVPSNYGPAPETEPGWEGSVVFLPWYLYLFNGDRSALADSYDAMSDYLGYLHSRSTGGLLLNGTLGDWATPDFLHHPPETPHLLQSAYYYRLVDLYATISAILGASAAPGDPKRAAYLENERAHRDIAQGDPTSGRRRDGTDSIKKAFNSRFLDLDKKVYTTREPVGYRQTSNVLPLHFGLVPKEYEDAVFQNLVHDILVTRNGHLDVGIFGLKHLAEVLIDHGRGDVPYLVFGQPDFPSLASLVSDGQGTLKEWWNPSRARSLNHKMYASVVDWMYQHVAGISYDAAHPGFQRFIVQPLPGGDLTYAKASYQSAYGTITSRWNVAPGGYSFAVTVPLNTTADVRIPKDRFRDVVIEESGVEVWKAGIYRPGVPGIARLGGEAPGYISFHVESGSYLFRLRGASPVATFDGVDSDTRGSWKAIYGNSGYHVRGLPSERGVHLPPYLQVISTGGIDETWKASTDDPRALQKPDGPDRIASHTYTTGTQTVDVAVTDGIETRVALYLLGRDRDSVFQVEVVDPAIGANGLLDRRTVSDSRNGTYLRYRVRGRVRFRINRGTGDRAAFSGVFFDRAATFIGIDSTTRDSWKGVYGTDGYDAVGVDEIDGLLERPSYVTDLDFSETAPEGAPPRFPARPPRPTISLNVNDRAAKEVALYFPGHETEGAFDVNVIDPRLGEAVIDRRRVSTGRNGIYVRYKVRGPVRFRFTNVRAGSAKVSGIFYGSSAVLSGFDPITRSNWKAVYGKHGYQLGDLAGEKESASRLPPYATVAHGTGGTGGEQTIDVTVDGGQKRVALYLVGSIEKGTLTVTAEKTNPVSGETLVLDRQTLDDVKSGIYLAYKIIGRVRLRIRGAASRTATVKSALFFDQPVEFSGADRETRGKWTEAYGADWYEIREFPKKEVRKLPPDVEVTYTGGIDYTWPDGADTTDPRALQDPYNPAARKAACRYSVESQTIRVNVLGEAPKDFSIYFLDWDRTDRALMVELIDAETLAPIEDRRLVAFGEGIYLNYKVKGRVLFRLTKTKGDNAVFSGVFLGRKVTAGPENVGRRPLALLAIAAAVFLLTLAAAYLRGRFRRAKESRRP